MISPLNISVFLTLCIMMALCVKLRKLTPLAAITAGLVGVSVFLGSGLHGLLILFSFFILSILATSHKKELKWDSDDAKVHPQSRTSGQVLANGGVAAVLGLFAFINPFTALDSSLFNAMMAGSLASALADTLSSELGMVYGRRFFNILTLKRERNGLDGVISIEGTLIGAAGALIIAILFAGWNILTVVVATAGIAGNLFDSLLGAAFERRNYIGNNLVNFLNTLFAALFVMFYYVFFLA